MASTWRCEMSSSISITLSGDVCGPLRTALSQAIGEMDQCGAVLDALGEVARNRARAEARAQDRSEHGGDAVGVAARAEHGRHGAREIAAAAGQCDQDSAGAHQRVPGGPALDELFFEACVQLLRRAIAIEREAAAMRQSLDPARDDGGVGDCAGRLAHCAPHQQRHQPRSGFGGVALVGDGRVEGNILEQLLFVQIRAMRERQWRHAHGSAVAVAEACGLVPAVEQAARGTGRGAARGDAVAPPLRELVREAPGQVLAARIDAARHGDGELRVVRHVARPPHEAHDAAMEAEPVAEAPPRQLARQVLERQAQRVAYGRAQQRRASAVALFVDLPRQVGQLPRIGPPRPGDARAQRQQPPSEIPRGHGKQQAHDIELEHGGCLEQARCQPTPGRKSRRIVVSGRGRGDRLSMRAAGAAPMWRAGAPGPRTHSWVRCLRGRQSEEVRRRSAKSRAPGVSWGPGKSLARSSTISNAFSKSSSSAARV